MSEIHTEATFEAAIVDHLTQTGWEEGKSSDFNQDIALDRAAILQFVQVSQPKEWARLLSFYKSDTESKFIQRLFKELDLRGMLDVLRHGITDSGVKFKMAYFKPDSQLNPDTLTQYGQNRLTSPPKTRRALTCCCCSMGFLWLLWS